MKNPLCASAPLRELKFYLTPLAFLIILTPTVTLALPTSQLKNWQYNPKAQQLEITLSAQTTPKYFYLPQPPRLVVDLPNTQLGRVATTANYQGSIQKIRLSQLNATDTRIVFDLAPGTVLEPNQVKLQPLNSQNPTRWVLRPLISNHSTTSQTANSLFPSPLLTLPPATTTANGNQPFITVPPLNSPPVSSPSPNSAPELPNVPVIEFGQPLPQQ
jgi:hypothetical protein